jgi:hypothetical protein
MLSRKCLRLLEHASMIGERAFAEACLKADDVARRGDSARRLGGEVTPRTKKLRPRAVRAEGKAFAFEPQNGIERIG